MEEFYNTYYLRTREDGAIIDAWSDGPHPEKDTAGAVAYNTKGSYQMRLYPDGEENPSIWTMDGIPMYKYIDGEITPRTSEEIEDERAKLPPAPPSEMEQLRADVDFALAMIM